MRKKIPAGIIIFASLSSIIIAAIIAAYILTCPRSYMSDFFFPYLLFYLLFFVFWIITTTFLIRLKNWARIAYIIIHMILVLFILGICIGVIAIICYFSGSLDIEAAVFTSLIFLLPFFYSIRAIIYFSRSDIAELFKE